MEKDLNFLTDHGKKMKEISLINNFRLLDYQYLYHGYRQYKKRIDNTLKRFIILLIDISLLIIY